MKIPMFSTIFTNEKGEMSFHYDSPFYGLQQKLEGEGCSKPLKVLENVEGVEFTTCYGEFYADGKLIKTEADHMFHESYLELGEEVARVDNINPILDLKLGVDLESPYGFTRHIRFTHRVVATINGELMCVIPNVYGFKGIFVFEVFEFIPRDTPCVIYMDFTDVNISWGDTVLKINRHEPLRYPNVHSILLSRDIVSEKVGNISIVRRKEDVSKSI